MPTTVVVARGNVEHRYRFAASAGKMIVDSSCECRIVKTRYIGGDPSQVCHLHTPIFTLGSGRKELDVLLQFRCDPPSTCPDFEIAISWEEAGDGKSDDA